ncbi:alpha-L-fucosidase [Scopulibacillus darangshiensis]|uniref:alpha-L-fucosidase n=1 Tax=Scopulibacillus darangshiensis TaxID=442528 RepID=A0A4R2NP69_9BACL|nr:alpha-L-fucosidase [Scopulibacillus darangshiensis]TCP23527.1 alpha-L-fucosidase [Scopulibacillus darangshiensis]
MEVMNCKHKMKWWKDAKFGMFIHWGLYAVLKKGEWVMYSSKIPVHKYEKLARKFNPIKFDAKQWVRIAKNAGMKYIVITAKHHEGFAMFQSKTSPYNIVDATPFNSDPLKELAEECQKEGIKLCFYYSHVIDWHHPDSLHDRANNTWDYELDKKDFYKYWNGLAKPQIKELLTEYGPIGLMWFDTAGGLSKEDSEEMVQLVRSLQPDCLINSRVSHCPGMGDYQSKGDNEIPMLGQDAREFETPMTMNQSWGYSDKDQVWKTTASLLRKLVNIVSKGGNLLLNVGPTPDGEIPGQSVERLAEIGEWLDINGEAFYGTSPCPYPYELEWGSITMKSGYLYLHVYSEYWPQANLQLYGLRNKILKAYILSDPNKASLEFIQTYDSETNHYSLSIEVPNIAPDKNIAVIALKIDGEIDVDESLTQQPSGSIRLAAFQSEIQPVEASGEKSEGSERRKTALWHFKVVNPGTFEVVIVNFKKSGAIWEEAYQNPVVISLAGKKIVGKAREDVILEDSPNCQYPYREVHSNIGELTINRPGVYALELISDMISPKPKGTEIWQAEAVKFRNIKLMRKKDI